MQLLFGFLIGAYLTQVWLYESISTALAYKKKMFINI